MIQWKENSAVGDLTTFGIGGPATISTAVKTIEEMQEAIRFCNEQKLRFFILGKGSNCLFDDRGINCALIVNKIDFIKQQDEHIYVGAGTSFSRLGAYTARKGWSGLEFASGIPGSVGGAVFMNAGANKRETCDSLLSVEFVDKEGNLHTFSKDTLEFSYRHSSFHEMNGAIVTATFILERSETAREDQLKIINYRTSTQPYGDKSAGCIFRNPQEGHAGEMIDKIGLKGARIGGAEVSPMHANFIVNRENATSSDVLKLIENIQKQVKEQTGVTLEREVRYIPYDWGSDD